MAEKGHRVYATQTVRVSATIEAPLRYVYGWATDYRADDSRLSRRVPKPKFRVVRLSARRVLRIRTTGRGADEPAVAVDVVRLSPPAAWHTDQIDEEDLESVDYSLTALGPRRTRIDLRVTERWLVPDHPSRAEVAERVRSGWLRYAQFIEEDYRRGRPARG
jgi:hypothetical protein